jgi:hypothetical protein
LSPHIQVFDCCLAARVLLLQSLIDFVPALGSVERVFSETSRWSVLVIGAFTKLTSTCRLSELRLRLINPNASANELKTTLMSRSIIHGDAYFAYFNRIWGIP